MASFLKSFFSDYKNNGRLFFLFPFFKINCLEICSFKSECSPKSHHPSDHCWLFGMCFSDLKKKKKIGLSYTYSSTMCMPPPLNIIEIFPGTVGHGILFYSCIIIYLCFQPPILDTWVVSDFAITNKQHRLFRSCFFNCCLVKDHEHLRFVRDYYTK